MVERGHRIYATQTVRVSKTIEAPLRYVYEWATDYRSDDWRLSSRRPRPRFRVLKISPHRVMRIRLTPTGGPDPQVAVDIVRLAPPSAWHTDQMDEDDRETIDYRLVRLGPKRTRLDLLVTERWLIPDYPTRTQVAQRVRNAWNRYGPQIEERFCKGLPAKG